MKVLTVNLGASHTTPRCGAEYFIVSLMHEFAKRGKATILCSQSGAIDGVSVERYPGIKNLIQVDRTKRGPTIARMLEAEFDPARLPRHDVVLASYWISFPAAEKIAAQHGSKLCAVFQTHSFMRRGSREKAPSEEIERRRKIEQRMAEKADLILAYSENERRLIQKNYGAPRKKIVVVPPLFDLQAFFPGDAEKARRALRLPLKRKIVLFAGRLEEDKGAFDVIETAKRVKKPLFVVCGEGPARKQLERIAPKNVVFRGWVDRETVPVYFRAADAVLYPSYYECFGLPAVEANASGTPLVAYKGVLGEVVGHDENGLLARRGNLNSLENATRLVLRNDGLRRRLVNDGLRRAKLFKKVKPARDLHAHFASRLTPRK